MVNRKMVPAVVLLVALMSVVAFPVLGAAGETESAAPVLDDVLACKASPVEPAAGDEGQAVPAQDLFNPEPEYVCLSGWCSSDTQCVQWFGAAISASKARVRPAATAVPLNSAGLTSREGRGGRGSALALFPRGGGVAGGLDHAGDLFGLLLVEVGLDAHEARTGTRERSPDGGSKIRGSLHGRGS